MKGNKLNIFENFYYFNVFKRKKYINKFDNSFLQDMLDWDVPFEDINKFINKVSKVRTLSKEEMDFQKIIK